MNTDTDTDEDLDDDVESDEDRYDRVAEMSDAEFDDYRPFDTWAEHRGER